MPLFRAAHTTSRSHRPTRLVGKPTFFGTLEVETSDIARRVAEDAATLCGCSGPRNGRPLLYSNAPRTEVRPLPANRRLSPPPDPLVNQNHEQFRARSSAHAATAFLPPIAFLPSRPWSLCFSTSYHSYRPLCHRLNQRIDTPEVPVWSSTVVSIQVHIPTNTTTANTNAGLTNEFRSHHICKGRATHITHSIVLSANPLKSIFFSVSESLSPNRQVHRYLLSSPPVPE